MPLRIDQWLLVSSALAATYLFAQTLLQVNEHFDASPPKTVRAKVLRQHTRYTPLPIRVATVSDAEDLSYRVDVLPALSFSLLPGDILTVVSKRGRLGKPWLQEERRYESLQKSRRLLGLVWLIVSALVVLAWLIVAARLRALRLGVAAMCVSFLTAIGLFSYLL